MFQTVIPSARILIYFMSSLFCIGITQAENISTNTTETVYEAIVPTTFTDQATQQAAVKQAFIQAISKLTGDRKALNKVAKNKLSTTAEQYLQRYEFRKIQNQGYVAVRFTSDFESALNQLGLRAWSEEFRPAILSWIVFDKTSPVWLTPDEANLESELFSLAAKEFGINLLYPVLDLEDRQLLNFSEVTKGNRKLLEASAQRYNAPVILSGTLSEQASSQWKVKWRLLVNGKEHVWEVQKTNLAELFWESMGGILDRVAPVFINGAPATVSTRHDDNRTTTRTERAEVTENVSGKTTFILRVTDVNNLQDYTKLQQYLRGLAGVVQVQTLEVQPQNVSFELTLKKDEAAFTQFLKGTRILTPNGDNTYRYTP